MIKNEQKRFDAKFKKHWYDIVRRCTDKKSDRYKNYGARGITISKKWIDFNIFKKDMYKSYIKYCKNNPENSISIERKDVNKNYSKENCCWIDKKYQSRNKSILPQNTSGYTGVSINNTQWNGKRRGKKWRALIYSNNKKYSLGMYDTALEAHYAYKKAKKELWK